MIMRKLLAAGMLWGAAVHANALTLCWVFDNNMVLQADRPVPVWGQGTPGESVTVKFKDQTNSVVVDAGGQWALTLATMGVSTNPATLTIEAPSGTKVCTNVLVGDVWICSGQSNMAQPTMGQATGYETETNKPLNHLVRAYYAPYNMWSVEPQTNNFSGSRVSNWHYWETIAGRTPAVPYYFAQMLQAETERPVGLLVVPVGASAAEPWVPLSYLLADTNFYAFATQTVSYIVNYSNNLAAFDVEHAQWEADKAAALSNGVPFTVPEPTKNFRPEFSPKWWGGALYNSYIAPLRNMSVKGAIWYQGENNAAGMGGVTKTTDGYHKLMHVLAQAWRDQFEQPDMPFFIAQLSMFNWDDFGGKQTRDPNVPGSWSIIREAQELAARSIPHSGLAISVDVGEKANIHPNNKKPVGERLARLALRDIYSQPFIADGPSYASHTIEGSTVRVTFTNTFGGLVRGERPEVTNGAVVGFAVAGTNQTFYWGQAVITGDQVLVTSTSVPAPVAVRYGYVQYHDVNLFNAAGLPAVPFRSDGWELAPGIDMPVDELDVVKENNTNYLNLASSWVDGVVPGTNNVALWNNVVTNSKRSNLGASMALAGIKIFDPGGKVIVGNDAGVTNTLTVGYSGINMASAMADLDLDVPVILATSQTWDIRTNRILNNNGNFNTGGLNVDFRGQSLTVQGGGGLALTRMTGSGEIIKSGAGSIRIQSGGTYTQTANMTIYGGTVRVGNQATALGSGPAVLTLAGGRLEPLSNLAVNYARTTTVSASSFIHNNNSQGTGAQTYTFKNLYIGPHTLTVTAQGTNAGVVIFGPTVLSGSATFDVSSRPTNHLRVGSISEVGGSFGFTKTGVGTMIITNASSFTGPTIIQDGALALRGAGTMGASTSIMVRSLLDVSGVNGGNWALGAGQLLQGTGTVIGAATVSGRLSPGDPELTNVIGGTIGVLTTSNLTLNSGAILDWEAGVATDDLVSVNGVLSLASSFSGTLNVGDAGATVAPADMLTLLTWTSDTVPVTNGWSWTINLPAGWTGTPVVHMDEAGKRIVLSGIASGSGPVHVPPEVDNGAGAQQARSRSAWLTGNLVSTGSASTTIYFFWGTNDGVTSAGAWGANTNLGSRDPGAFSNFVQNLDMSATNYYRSAASNAGGFVWATATVAFATAEYAPGLTKASFGMVTNGFGMQWPGEPGWRYTVEYTDDLKLTNGWQPDPGFTDVPAVDGLMSYLDPLATGRYYRLWAE